MENGERFELTLDIDKLKRLGEETITLDVETREKLGDNLRFRFIGKYLFKIIDSYIELVT